MAVYHGPPLAAGAVSLAAPNPQTLGGAVASADLTEGEKGWYKRSLLDDGCLYFEVDEESRPIGQVLLHDVDAAKGEALVGYHIFRGEDRGRGAGTAALGALCRYAFERQGLVRLVMITAVANMASRRIAEKCGFREIGPAREGPDLVAYELRRP